MNKKELKNIFRFLDNSEYSFDQDVIDNHCTDWRGDFIGTSNIILFPKSNSSISRIIKVCEKNHIPIIPQGGNTGLVGGSVPRKDKGEIILNLKNMNKMDILIMLGDTPPMFNSKLRKYFREKI